MFLGGRHCEFKLKPPVLLSASPGEIFSVKTVFTYFLGAATHFNKQGYKATM